MLSAMFYLLLIVLQNHVSSTNNMFGQTDIGIAAACVVCFDSNVGRIIGAQLLNTGTVGGALDVFDVNVLISLGFKLAIAKLFRKPSADAEH